MFFNDNKTLASDVRVTLTAPGGVVGSRVGHVLGALDITNSSPIIEDTWATSEGGALTRERENNWDGGGGYDILVGKVTAEDITLTRAYVPLRDDGWMKDLRDLMRKGCPAYYTVTKQNYHCGSKVGKPEVHVNCPVLTLRTFQAAAGPEATATTIEIVLATKGPEK